MPVNVKDLKEKRGTRFYWDCEPGDEYEEWIEIRQLSPADIEDIEKQTRRVVEVAMQSRKENGRIDKRSAIQLVEKSELIDGENSKRKEEQLRYEKSITAWKLYQEDDSGNLTPFEYSSENIMFLMRESTEFVTFWAKSIESLTEKSKEIRECQKKTYSNLQKNTPEKSDVEIV